MAPLHGCSCLLTLLACRLPAACLLLACCLPAACLLLLCSLPIPHLLFPPSWCSPIIQLHSAERLPAMHTAASALAKLETGGCSAGCRPWLRRRRCRPHRHQPPGLDSAVAASVGWAATLPLSCSPVSVFKDSGGSLSDPPPCPHPGTACRRWQPRQRAGWHGRRQQLAHKQQHLLAGWLGHQVGPAGGRLLWPAEHVGQHVASLLSGR